MAWLEDGYAAQVADRLGPAMRVWPCREWFDQPFGVAQGPEPVEELTVPSPACGGIEGHLANNRGRCNLINLI